MHHRPTPAVDGRPKALAGIAAFACIIALPIVQFARPRASRTDGFPFSYYPMFSAARSRSGTVHHLVGVDADGRRHILHHAHAGTGGLNQVRRQINRRVREGAADIVAAAAARSVAASTKPEDARIRTVEVVSSTHRFDEFFAGNREPRRRVVHATAPVARPGVSVPTMKERAA